eukprot:Clim_evm15s84 gene=Clim_evmTU15s84
MAPVAHTSLSVLDDQAIKAIADIIGDDVRSKVSNDNALTGEREVYRALLKKANNTIENAISLWYEGDLEDTMRLARTRSKSHLSVNLKKPDNSEYDRGLNKRLKVCNDAMDSETSSGLTAESRKMESRDEQERSRFATDFVDFARRKSRADKSSSNSSGDESVVEVGSHDKQQSDDSGHEQENIRRLNALTWPVKLGVLLASASVGRSGQKWEPEQYFVLTRGKHQQQKAVDRRMGKGTEDSRTSIVMGRNNKVNNTVYFRTDAGIDIGRVHSEFTQYLCPMLDHNIITVDGHIVEENHRAEMGTDFTLICNVYLNRTGLRILLETDINTSLEKVAAQSAIKEGFLGLLDQMDVQPTAVGSTAGRTRQRILDIARSNQNAKEDELNDAAENTQQLTSEDLLGLYSEVADVRDDIMVKPPSKHFRSNLRPYQQKALSWMIAREEDSGSQPLEQDLTLEEEQKQQLHPLWVEYQFDGAKYPVYYNPYTGEMDLVRPQAAKRAMGGILADEMGLGKTVQIIALITTGDESIADRNAERATAASKQSGTSVKADPVGPTLVVSPLSLVTQWKEELILHSDIGTDKILIYHGSGRNDKLDFRKYRVVLTSYGTMSSEWALRKGEGPLHAFTRWNRIVIDEAHMIKNRNTQVSKAATAMEARTRWCLTGTPILNSLDDMYALVRFLHVDPWQSWPFWNTHISKPFNEERSREALDTMKAVLRPLVLRRTKDMMDESGKPILTLPPKNTLMIRVELSQEEREFYDAIFNRTFTRFQQFEAAGSLLKNYASVLEWILRLRQACDHPFLTMANQANKQSDVNKLLDSSPLADLDELINRFVENSIGKANFDYVRATAESMKTNLTKFATDTECPICLDTVEDPLIGPCMHPGCRKCYEKVVFQLRQCPVCREDMMLSELEPLPLPKPEDEVQSTSDKGTEEAVDSGTASGMTAEGTEAGLSKEALSHIEESSKIRSLLEDIEDHCEEKCVVFSQWTSMLDLVEKALRKRKVKFVRLDGSCNLNTRRRLIEVFMDPSSDVTVFLISIRAGGVGLNLTAATRLHVLDPWWNAHVEEQAINRVHRIGQDKPVTVRRYIAKRTIEERLLLLQKHKSAIVEEALALSKEEESAMRLENLKLLFNPSTSLTQSLDDIHNTSADSSVLQPPPQPQ